MTFSIIFLLFISQSAVLVSCTLNQLLHFKFFESCGAFVDDISEIKFHYERDDIHTHVIHSLMTKDNQPVLVQNNSQWTDHYYYYRPAIFWPTKFNCFLHIHLSFGIEILLTNMNTHSFLFYETRTFYFSSTFLTLMVNTPVLRWNLFHNHGLIKISETRIFLAEIKTNTVNKM